MIYRPQRSWGEVMFLHASLILFTWGWYPSMPCSRSPGGGWYPSMPCRSLGPHPRGKLSGLAWGVSRPTPRGVSRPTPGGVSRPTPRGVSRPTPEGSPGPQVGEVSQHALRQTPLTHTHQTATAAGGTHPTGMHTCCFFIHRSGSRNFEKGWPTDYYACLAAIFYCKILRYNALKICSHLSSFTLQESKCERDLCHF